MKICIAAVLAAALAGPPTAPLLVDPRLKALIEDIASAGWDKHDAAVKKLREAITEKDVRALVEMGEDRREMVRQGILRAFYKFGDRPRTEPHPVPVDYLIRRMKDESSGVRGLAAGFCYYSARHSTALTPYIVAALDDHTPGGQGVGNYNTPANRAVGALISLGKDARPYYAKAIKLAETGTKLERGNALRAIAQMGLNDPSWRPLLLGCLIRRYRAEGIEDDLKLTASGAIKVIGRDAAPAVSALREGMRSAASLATSKAQSVLGNAMSTLKAIGPPAHAALPEILAVMVLPYPRQWPEGHSQSWASFRGQAIDAIVALRFDADTVTPRLQRVADDPKEHPEMRERARKAIRELRAAAR